MRPSQHLNSNRRQLTLGHSNQTAQRFHRRLMSPTRKPNGEAVVTLSRRTRSDEEAEDE